MFVNLFQVYLPNVLIVLRTMVINFELNMKLQIIGRQPKLER